MRWRETSRAAWEQQQKLSQQSQFSLELELQHIRRKIWQDLLFFVDEEKIAARQITVPAFFCWFVLLRVFGLCLRIREIRTKTSN